MKIPGNWSGTGAMRLPGQINLSLTYRCQCHCRMCDQFKPDEGMKELEFDDVTGLIDRLVGSYPRGKPPKFVLSGGECFCRPFAIDVLEYLNSKGIPTEVITNLGIPGGDVLDRLSRLDALQLFVSIDGYGSTHDEIRRSSGLYESVREKLRRLDRSGKRANIYYTVSRLNYFDIERTFADLQEIIDVFCVLHLNWHSEQRISVNQALADELGIVDDYPVVPSFTLENARQVDELRSSFGRLARKSGRFFPGSLRMPLDTHYLFDELPPPGICKLVSSELGIHPDGHANFCFSSGRSVLETGLPAVWNDPRREWIVDRMRGGIVFPKCARCCMFIPGKRLAGALYGISRRLLTRSQQNYLKKRYVSRLIERR